MSVTFGTTVTVTLNSVTSINSGTMTVTSGQPIVVTVQDQALGTLSIADTFGTPYAWIALPPSGGPGGVNNRVSQFLGTNGVGTSGVITVTSSATQFVGGTFTPCIGASTASGLSVLVGGAAAINSGTGTTATSPSLTPTVAGCGAVYGVMNNVFAISANPSAPWTSFPVTLSGTQYGGSATDASPTSGSALSTTWTQASGQWYTSGLLVLPPTVAGTAFYEIQQSLNVLAYGAFPPASGGIRDAQKAANDWAGTTNLDLLAALNCKFYGTTKPNPSVNYPLDLNTVCNKLAGTTLKDAQDALSNLAGGFHT